MSSTEKQFVPLNVAVVTVSDTRVEENDASGDLIVERFERAGHNVVNRSIERENIGDLKAAFRALAEDPNIDAVVSTGGSGLTQRDITPEATAELFDKSIPGFGELFRMLSYDEIGSSTIESRAVAGVASGTIVFNLPGSARCEPASDGQDHPQSARFAHPPVQPGRAAAEDPARGTTLIAPLRGVE